MISDYSRERWTSAWPDALAFVLGLGVAWYAGWTTADLVWSLWLSSFVVGYATILWAILRPAVRLAMAAHEDPSYRFAPPHLLLLLGGIVLGVFLLAFFTVHFGFFHYVHSQFLHLFFPIDATNARDTAVDMSTYAEVVRRYWHFLPAALIAERAAFSAQPKEKDDLSVTAEAIAKRKRRNAMTPKGFTAPYRNVMRMHLLIFFFAFASMAGLEHFAVYAVVYAVYFFPFRLIRANRPVTAPQKG
jgi:hypothetical protein